MKRSTLLLGLVAVTIITGAIVFSTDPDLAARYSAMRRSVGFDASTQEMLMALIALAVGGTLVWSYLKRD